jgi:hypothetical protein
MSSKCTQLLSGERIEMSMKTDIQSQSAEIKPNFQVVMAVSNTPCRLPFFKNLIATHILSVAINSILRSKP